MKGGIKSNLLLRSFLFREGLSYLVTMKYFLFSFRESGTLGMTLWPSSSKRKIHRLSQI